MPLVINTNVASLNAQRLLSNNAAALQKNFERLASGYRINRAADDAAGLQISETLRSQIRGTGQAINNAQDGLNLLSIAEGTMGVVQEHLQRMRELTVQAASDTNGSAQRDAIRAEIKERMSEINRITRTAEFNGILLLHSATPSSLRLQVGANARASLDTIDISGVLGSATATGLGLGNPGTTGSVNFSNNSAARDFLSSVDNALKNISTRRASIGALQNRLDGAISNLQITLENLESSESRIRNVDVAKEAALMTRNQILQQASASILAQANQAPTLALSLIGN